MNCPKCGESFEVHLNEHLAEGVDFEELEFTCPNEHEYFVRVREEDLMEIT